MYLDILKIYYNLHHRVLVFFFFFLAALGFELITEFSSISFQNLFHSAG
jgi:hypothetical protein